MALPLLWLGAAALSAIAAKGLADDRKSLQKQRSSTGRPQTLNDLERHESPVATYPTEIFTTEQVVKPQVGAIVCCGIGGIGGILDHTGIVVDDDTIVELDGKGLIKPVSTRRFTAERSGKQIFIACDSTANPIVDKNAALLAMEQIFQYRDYHFIENNCHQFIWQCFEPGDTSLFTFKELNIRLAQKFDRKVYWDLCDNNKDDLKHDYGTRDIEKWLK